MMYSYKRDPVQKKSRAVANSIAPKRESRVLSDNRISLQLKDDYAPFPRKVNIEPSTHERKFNEGEHLLQDGMGHGSKNSQPGSMMRNVLDINAVGDTMQKAKMTPAKRLEKLKHVVKKKSSDKTNVKTFPRNKKSYKIHKYKGRDFFSKKDKEGRVIKIKGSLAYCKDARVGTPKVAYKRKNDAAGHLIAHSFGGPPQETENFVAMGSRINSAGGDWGRMEGYIRSRLQQKNIEVWMSVRPTYTGKGKRPTSITAKLTFNKSPYKITFKIPTP